MQKNWMQIAVLCLCAVLLVMTVVQGVRLEEYQQQMQIMMEDLKSSVADDIRDISSNIGWQLEEARQVVAECALEPVRLDKENRAMVTNLSVTLKEWYDDTEVTLLATVDEEEISLPLTSDGKGSFTGQLALPLEQIDGVWFYAMIRGGGLTRQEPLNVYADYSTLLSLQSSGGGWDGPGYEDGVLSSQFYIQIEDQFGQTQVNNPEFWIYKNGQLVQQLTAVVDPYASTEENNCYMVQGRTWSMECVVGDEIEIHFRCEDANGLGYDFLFNTWAVEEDLENGLIGVTSLANGPEITLFWPE